MIPRRSTIVIDAEKAEQLRMALVKEHGYPAGTRLEQILGDVYWTCERHADGSYSDVYPREGDVLGDFSAGGPEDWQVVCKELAPYVRDGSELEYLDDAWERYRFFFQQGTLTHQKAGLRWRNAPGWRETKSEEKGADGVAMAGKEALPTSPQQHFTATPTCQEYPENAASLPLGNKKVVSVTRYFTYSDEVWVIANSLEQAEEIAQGQEVPEVTGSDLDLDDVDATHVFPLLTLQKKGEATTRVALIPMDLSGLPLIQQPADYYYGFQVHFNENRIDDDPRSYPFAEWERVQKTKKGTKTDVRSA